MHMVVLDETLGGENGRMQLGVGVQVHPVQVHAPLVGAIMAALHAVRVQQWHQLEDVLFAQLYGTRVSGTEDEVEEAVEDEAGGGFARVHAATEEVHLCRDCDQNMLLNRKSRWCRGCSPRLTPVSPGFNF